MQAEPIGVPLNRGSCQPWEPAYGLALACLRASRGSRLANVVERVRTGRAGAGCAGGGIAAGLWGSVKDARSNLAAGRLRQRLSAVRPAWAGAASPPTGSLAASAPLSPAALACRRSSRPVALSQFSQFIRLGPLWRRRRGRRGLVLPRTNCHPTWFATLPSAGRGLRSRNWPPSAVRGGRCDVSPCGSHAEFARSTSTWAFRV